MREMGRRKKVIWPEGIPDTVEVKTAGISDPLTVHIGVSRCGDIEDGIAFHFGNKGGWVVERAELEAALDLCRKVREANQ